MSQLELQKRLIDLRNLSSRKQKDKLNRIFSNDIDIGKLKRFEDSISKEDEFILISKLLGNCEFITKIDNVPYLNSENYIAPDLLAAYVWDMHDKTKAFRMFIDVKKVYGEKWKITKKDFERRVNFAKLFSLPLHFAIKFDVGISSIWFLAPAEYVEKSGFTINLSNLKENHFDFLTGNLMIHVPEGIVETRIYDPSKKEGIYHADYGTLLEIIYKYGKKRVSVKPLEKPWQLILDRVPHKNQTVKKEDGLIKVMQKFDSNIIVQLYQILLWEVFYYFRDYNLSEFLIRLASKDVELKLTPQTVKILITDLNNEGFVKFSRMLPSSFFPSPESPKQLSQH